MAEGQDVRVYAIPSSSFHFGRPSESYLVYDNHRKMLSELYNNSKKYYCAEDIKSDLMALAAPIPACSTYDEVARISWAMLNQCDSLEAFQHFLEGWLNYPQATFPGSMVVPAYPKSEVGRSVLQPATELSRGCFAVCVIAVAALVCLAASCVVGYQARHMGPDDFHFPDWTRKDLGEEAHIRDGIRASELRVR